ncbi:amidohydrolase family protein [Blastomonas sp. CACIA14H2]|uniref:amidohydrolase family protein n=1 Tax=Blastomonas sp. CACIA14H2 TaxID=1419876 RepID=UPI000414340A
MAVDIHAHLNVAAAETTLRQAMPDLPKGLPYSCPASDAVNARMFAAIGPKLNGVEARLADMDQQGVDVQALSPNPGQYYYFTQPEMGRDLACTINDGVAEAVASAPDRLVGIGTVPLQNVEMAIAEMRRAVGDLNMRGIEIGSNVGGRDLSDPEFRPFFAAAEDLGILLFLHPLGFTQGQRLSDHYLNNLIGNPLESTIAVSHLIFGGVLDAYPGLKICVAHGGGYLPTYTGRMDHAFRAREDCRQHITREPSSYLRQLWFDSLVFDHAQLDHLVATYGADRICMGSDYPFDMGDADPVGFLERLPEDARAKVLGCNAASLLNLQTGDQL